MADISLITWTLLVSGLAFLTYKLVTLILDIQRRAKGVQGFPCPQPKHWFYGHLKWDETGERSEELLSLSREWNKLYPRAHQFWLSFAEPMLFVRHPDLTKMVLKQASPKPRTYAFMEPWLGEGLLTGSGKKWARNRRLLTPAFHFDILKPYMAINNDSSETLIKKMDKSVTEGCSFDLYSNCCLSTLDVILRCAMSYENDAQVQGQSHPYVNCLITLGEMLNERIFKLNPLFQIDTIYYMTSHGREFKKKCDYLHEVSNKIIQKRRETLNGIGEKKFLENKKYLDFLDVLLTAKDDAGIGLTHKEIQDEVDTFLFEGHDTTASALAWTLYMLAKHPEHQRKCQEEVDRVLMGRKNKDLEWNDMGKLEHITLCLKESMRLNATVPWIHRMLTSPVVMDGNTIEPGTIIMLDLYALHHHPDIWKNPTDYIPERFKDTSDMDPFAYVPFSAGPRNCIGQNFALNELKVTIGRVLHEFDMVIDTETEPRRQINIVMRAMGKLNVKLRRRIMDQ